MSLHSFTKSDLITCFKAGNKWMNCDTESVESLVDMLQPGSIPNSGCQTPQYDNKDEIKLRIEYIIGRHILKGRSESKPWRAYLKILKVKKDRMDSVEEPQHLFFKRQTRSSTVDPHHSQSSIN
ncbi:LAFA_0F03906g1_1 [Lachancea sp. 'fantastica']|nr:LAFA_0F03906g1_1 [Lachancea sp. 'fantastica']